MATEQQIHKLAATLVEHQAKFKPMKSKDAQYVIQNTSDAIRLFIEAIQNRQVRSGSSDEILPGGAGVVPLGKIIQSTSPEGNFDFERVGVKALHPDLREPIARDEKEVIGWLHPDQESRSIKGMDLYRFLKEHNLLRRCLGYNDRHVAIKVFWGRLRNADRVYLWRSVIQNQKGGLEVPYVYKDSSGLAGDYPAIGWDFIEGISLCRWNFFDRWDGKHPALMIKE